MNTKEIKKHNGDKFLIDIRRVASVMMQSQTTFDYYHINKKEVIKNAESMKINYRMTDKVFRVRRDVMVIE